MIVFNKDIVRERIKDKDMSNKVVIVGGGASGLVAAITAARGGANVTILEHKDRVGKKILMTGNGKCNLTNMSNLHGKYYSTDEKSLNMIYEAFDRFSAKDTIDFFESIGLYTKEKRDGGVYPMSEQAACVLDVLRSECEHLKVDIITDCDIQEIINDKNKKLIKLVKYIRDTNVQNEKNNGKKKAKNKQGEIIGEEKIKLIADNIILATGGKAAAVAGSDGSGYVYAKKMGHSIVEPLPALVQLRCKGDYFKSISGVRTQAGLKLYVDNQLVACEEGELQLTDYGISGIPVFQFSRIAARALYESKPCKVMIDFLPQLPKNPDLEKYSYKKVEEFLSGMVNKKIASLICRKNGISQSDTIGSIGVKKTVKCVDELRQYEVEVEETNSFDNAQVCCGGVPLNEVSSDFESLKCKNVYIVGELLDCDGICGGYNLQWAWTTGIIAGRAVCK